MKTVPVVASVLFVASACTKPNPAFCDDNADCADSTAPFCDIAGDHGPANSCIPVPYDGGIGPDGGTDANSSSIPEVPRLLSPTNGAYTGSVHAATSLTPRFRWHASPNASTYEIEIDDSCLVFGFADCEFASPEHAEVAIVEAEYSPSAGLPVASTPPVGTRYFWRVRACNDAGCSPFSEIRYLDVGRQRTDYNGDGYADRLASGGNSSNAGQDDEGVVYVFLGSASLAATATIDSADVQLNDPQGEVNGEFGFSVTSAADVNGDGFADILVGAPSHDMLGPDRGAAYLYFGRETFPAATAGPDVNMREFDSANGDRFGENVNGAGDINGDGFADILISRLGDLQSMTAPVGRVHGLFGRPSWPLVLNTSDILFVDPQLNPSSYFGFVSSIASDVDGDGFADVIIGAPGGGSTPAEGVVHLYNGRDDWGPLPATVDVSDTTFDNPVDEKDGAFGLSISACGDLNADGYADLALAAPFLAEPEPFEGNVFLYFGTDQFPPSVDQPDVTIDNPRDVTGGFFGFALSTCGDVNADGFDDLAVGSPVSQEKGGLFIYFGQAVWPDTLIDADSAFDNPVDEFQAHLGQNLSCDGDMDGDGRSDIAAGSRVSNPEDDEGVVYLLYGRPAWPGVFSMADTVIDSPPDLADWAFGFSGRTAIH